MSKRGNASHRVIMMVVVDSKCEELEHLDKCDHVEAKVLKTRIRTARSGNEGKRSALLRFIVSLQFCSDSP